MGILDDAERSREERLWDKTREERIEAFYGGEFNLRDCLEWASRRPEEPPRAPDGEFLFIAVKTPEWADEEPCSRQRRDGGRER